MRRFYFALLPWGVFDVVLRSPHLSPLWAAGLALLMTCMVVVLCRPREVTPLDWSSLAIFTCLFVVSLVDEGGEPFRHYVRATATAALGVVIVASLLKTPFTQSYVQLHVRPRFWNTAMFRRVNVRISLYCAGSIFAIATLNLVAELVNSAVIATTFNWIVPIGLLIALGEATTATLDRQFDSDGPTINDVVQALDEIETFSTHAAPAKPTLYLFENRAASQ